MFQRFRTPLLVITFLVFAMLLPILFANTITKGVTDTLPQANAAGLHVTTARYNYLVQLVGLWILDIERAALTVSYNSNKTTMEKEAIELATAATPTSVLPTDLAANLKNAAGVAGKMAITYANDLALKKELVKKTIEIQKKKVVVSQYHTTLNSKYNHYVAHVEAFNKSNVTSSDDIDPAGLGEIPSDEIGVDTNLSVPCSNPKCNTVYSASVYGLDNIVTLSEGGTSGGYKGHLVTCSYDHAVYDVKKKQAKRQGYMAPNGPYWSCPPDYSGCPKRSWHVLLCRGNCGEYKRFMKTTVGYPWQPHLVNCKKKVPRTLANLWSDDCHGTYYSCTQTSTDCTNATNHIDGDDDDDGSDEQTQNEFQQPPPTLPSTPSYHTCGVHETSVSGTHSAAGCGVSGHYVCDGSDHSLQASCTTTNASGQSCTVTSFYACQTHTHVYPSSNGNNGNTEVTCSHCSNTYDTTNSGDYIYHNNTATCNRLGCGLTFIMCEYYTNLCQSPDHKYHSY